MNHEYSEFRELVKRKLRANLAAWNLSEQDLEEYVQKEEEQIKGAYDGYLHPRPNDQREDEVRFNIDASTIAYCLEMCY